jgi:predicted Co/Zn/Cd cation transporter (cation efflux family)
VPDARRRGGTLRVAALVLVWAAATVVVAAVALSAAVGRADWGDGGGRSVSTAGLVALLAAAVAAVAAAAWVTARLSRGSRDR